MADAELEEYEEIENLDEVRMFLLRHEAEGIAGFTAFIHRFRRQGW